MITLLLKSFIAQQQMLVLNSCNTLVKMIVIFYMIYCHFGLRGCRHILLCRVIMLSVFEHI